MNIRAKFNCNNVVEVRQKTWNTETAAFNDQESKVAESVSMFPVYDSNPESPNYKWSAATPSGKLELYISNPEAWGSFKPQSTYYLDITEAVD